METTYQEMKTRTIEQQRENKRNKERETRNEMLFGIVMSLGALFCIWNVVSIAINIIVQ